MLFETLAVIVLILPISASSAWGLRNDFFKKWYLVILAFGPIIDAWIIWYLLNWLELGFVATWGCTISAGLMRLFAAFVVSSAPGSIPTILAASQT
jgi:hypothetical protein